MTAAASAAAMALSAQAFAAPLPAGSELTAPYACSYPKGQLLDGTKTGFAGIESSGMYSLVATPDLPGGHWELRGRYPRAATVAYQVFNGLASITGFIQGKDVAPDPGSINPWQPGGRFVEGRDKWTLRVEYVPPSQRKNPPPPGVIYAGYRQGPGRIASTSPSNRQGGFLENIEGAKESYGGVPRPTAVWVVDDPKKNRIQNKQQLCTAMWVGAQPFLPIFKASDIFLQKWWDRVGTPRLTNVFLPLILDPISGWNGKPYVNVARPSPYGYSFPFAAQSADYISIAPSPNYGKFFVIRFKAPTYSHVVDGIPNTGDEQTGYWAWCGVQVYSYLVNTTGCLQAPELQQDDKGYVTLVVSPKDQRPIVDGEPYQNWLLHPGAGPLIWGEHYNANPRTFPQAAYFARPSLTIDPKAPILSDVIYGMTKESQLKRHMGEYFPQVYYCTKEKFEAGQCKPAGDGAAAIGATANGASSGG